MIGPVGVDLHEAGPWRHGMYCQLDAAAFGAHHQHVDLRAIRRTEGLGRTSPRGGHRRRSPVVRLR